MSKKCYNCGVPIQTLEKKHRTKEHIPAKAFFVGYPEKYKDQRKTVPACYCCNQEYAKIDDKLRDVIGILNDGELHKSELTRRAVSNILSNKKELNNRLTFTNNGAEISFDRIILDKLHKKNFKGIFHLATNQPISKEFLLDVYSDGHDEKKLDLGFEFLTEIENMGQWEKSGNADVFEYELTYYNFENEKLEKFDKSITEPLFLVCAMKYNNTIVSLVVATKPEIKDVIKT
tara:strand:- start:54 stop:749 length:696 start_codon:yes stop_codon:yes gene_type:complete